VVRVVGVREEKSRGEEISEIVYKGILEIWSHSTPATFPRIERFGIAAARLVLKSECGR
jgi:hypothetical protein